MGLDDFKLTSRSLWQKAAWFGTAYFFCAEVSSYLSARGGTFVSFWLPAGLSVAVLLLNRTRDWPWFLLAALPANFSFDLLHDPKPSNPTNSLSVASVGRSATNRRTSHAPATV